MTFLAPIAALGLLAIPTIILIHYLRGSRRRLRVPSVELWEGLAPGLTARNRVRRPPLSLLLLLQVLIAAGIGLALMRPAEEGDPIRHLGIVIDASASMQATDVGQSRFEAARQLALTRVRSLAPTDQVTLVRGGLWPSVEFSGSAREAEGAIRAMTPGAGSARLDDAVMRTAHELAHTADLQSAIIVITDAASEGSGRLGAGSFPLEILTVSGGGANQAVVNLTARVEPGARNIDVLAEVANYDARPARVALQILADDFPLTTRQIDVPARGRSPATFTAPLDTGRITTRIDNRDALALDNQAEVALPAIRPRTLLLVSNGGSAMERALRAIPGANVVLAGPGEYAGMAADLTIFDGVTPRQALSGPTLLVHPPAENGLVQVTGDLRLPAITQVDATHPLLTGVDVNALRLTRADRITAPTWAHTVLGTARGPLIVEGTREGLPVTIFAFDPVTSGFEKSIGFPVLVANAISASLGRVSGPSLRPGQVVSIPAPSDGRPAVIVRPDGQREQLGSAGPGAQYDRTDQIGRYSIQDATSQRTARTFSVSLLSPTESDTNPRAISSAPATEVDLSSVRRMATEWWWPLIAAAVGLLGVEWFVFARRG